MDASDPMATIEGLAGFTGRGAGTDAERRAANWLARRSSAERHDAIVETFWCRPNWALAHLWHVALAVTGSLVALASPIAAIAILAVALLSVVADGLTGVSLGRRLTPERASQNVVTTVHTAERSATAETARRHARLILTANYDAGRTGLAYRPWLRGIFVRASQALHGATPGWLGWLAIAIVWLIAVAVLRELGHTSQAVGALQFLPTVLLVVAFAVLLDLATGHWSHAATDNASGVAVVLAIASAVTTVAPQNLDLEIVLSGAGDGAEIGLRRYLRSRRPGPRGRSLRAPQRRSDRIVLGVGPCGGGTPRWRLSDGAFLPLRYTASLRRIAEQVTRDEPHLQLRPHRGRESGGALAARSVGLPALTIGCLDDGGLVPHSHQKADVPEAVDRQSLDRAIQFALLLVDAIDAAVGLGQDRPSPTRA